MSWSLVGTPDNRAVTSGQTSWTLTAGTVGNLRLIGTNVVSGSISISSLSGGGCSTWTQGAFLQDATQARTVDIWWGLVTSTGTALTVNYSSSIGTTAVQQNRFDFSPDKPSLAFAVMASGSMANQSSTTTVTFPSLTPSAPDQLYFGTERHSGGGSASSGGTSGFSYNTDSSGNSQPYNVNCAVSAQQPTSTLSVAGASLAVGVIIGQVPPGRGYSQAVNRAAFY